MSTPNIIVELINETRSAGWNPFGHVSISRSFEEFTGEAAPVDAEKIGDFYRLFEMDDEAAASKADAQELSSVIKSARQQRINNGGNGFFFNERFGEEALRNAIVKNLGDGSGTFTTFATTSSVDDLLTLNTLAEGLLDNRREVTWKSSAAAKNLSYLSSTYRNGAEPRSPAEATSPTLNEDLASAFYFMMWLRRKKDQASLQGIIKNGHLNVEERAQQLLDAIKNDLGIGAALDRDSSDDDREARIKIGTKKLSSTEFDKQKYMIQKIDDFENLAKKRFFYNSNDGQSSENSLASIPASSTDASFIEGGIQQLLGIPQTKILRFVKSQRNPVGKITGAAFGKDFFELSNEQLSKLVPSIRIWKVKYGKNMKKEGEVEIKFPTRSRVMREDIFDMNPSFTSNLNSKANPLTFPKTRSGYGIKSFSWSYDGNDPFSVDRDIGATLELYFQDFSQFTAVRGKNEKNSYRYLDLIVPLDREYTEEQKSRLGDFFQQDIRVEAGWQSPKSFSSSQLRAVKAAQVNFVLTPMDYNISFEGNGNGACTISINYRARIESLGKNRLINVIGATQDQFKQLQKLEKTINSTEDDESSVKNREDARTSQQELYKQIRSSASKKFIDRLMSRGSVYWRKVYLKEVMISTLGLSTAIDTYESLYDKTWDAFPPHHTDGLEESIEFLIEEGSGVPLESLPLITALPETEEEKEKGAPEKIIYTFFGDIVQNAVETAIESGNFLGAPVEAIENIKIALLDFRVGDRSYNMSDMPIEIGLLMEYMQDEIGKKDIQTISIISFINGLLAKVITNRIGEYLDLRDGTTRSFKIGYNSQNKDLLPGLKREYDLSLEADVESIRKSPRIDDIIVYSDSPILSDFTIKPKKYLEKKASDEKDGLHHFTLGSRKSIVKNISFDKIDLEYARERRLTLNKEDPYALLTNVFNVNISMFGNDYFKPGSYVYVDPKVMGDVGAPYVPGSIANTMGLGGYHIVTKVEHSISDNSFETKIEAVWETSGSGKFGVSANESQKNDARKAEERKEKEKKENGN